MRFACDKKATIPVLQGVLIAVDAPDGITVSATDLDLFISVPCLATVEAPGSLIVPLAALREGLRACAEKPSLVIETAPQPEGAETAAAASFTCGLFSWRLDTFDEEDWPKLSWLASPIARVNALALVAACNRVNFALSKNAPFAIHGINLEVQPGFIVLQVTDGHRLPEARIAADISESVSQQKTVLLGARASQYLPRIIKAATKATKETVVISSAVSPTPSALSFGHARQPDAQVGFECDGVRFWSKTIEASFPDAQPLFAALTNPKYRARFDTLPMLQAIRAVMGVLDRDPWNTIRLSFCPGTLTLGTPTTATTQATSQIPCDFQGPGPLSVVFTAVCLQQFLEVAASPYILFDTQDGSPALLSPCDAAGADPSYRYLLMPSRE